MYSKDISKKVHSSYLLKAQKGKFTGCVAPFGYMKDPDDKNHLVVDPETAPIVREIFRYALEGHGPNYIRRRLEDEKVPCPAWWNRERGIRNKVTKWELKDPENGRYVWDFTVIKGMLQNPVYVGDIASQKKVYRFKVGNIADKRPEDWVVVGDRHEPLIGRESFEAVQEQLRSRQRRDKGANPSLFAGLLKCGECGRALTVRCTNAKHPKRIYACKTYNAYGKGHCTQHRVEYDALYELVLEKIRECAKAAVADGVAVAGRMADARDAEERGRREALEGALARDTERYDVLEKLIPRLYDDMIAGRISEENFGTMLKRTQDEQESLRGRIADARKKLEDEGRIESDARQWLTAIGEYADIRELDAATLHRLVREIVVHEKVDEDDGTRHISIEIHFNLRPMPVVGQVTA